jgi:hypothetical protein
MDVCHDDNEGWLGRSEGTTAYHSVYRAALTFIFCRYPSLQKIFNNELPLHAPLYFSTCKKFFPAENQRILGRTKFDRTIAGLRK